MQSRCQAHCLNCDWTGPRSATFTPRPKSTPSFDDVCPRCHQDNVTVITPEALAQNDSEGDYDRSTST